MYITIIGAGKGISLSVAKLFGSKGYEIALIARNESNLQQFKSELEAQHITTHTCVADVSQPESLEEAFRQFEWLLGDPEMVLYNAFTPVFKRLEAESWESFKQQTDVNVGGAFHTIKHYLPKFKAANSGKLFFTGGILATHPQANIAGLSMGKAAMRNLVLGTAQGLRNSRVHIATLTVGGFVKPEDAKHNPDSIAQEFWKLFEQTPEEYQIEVTY